MLTLLLGFSRHLRLNFSKKWTSRQTNKQIYGLFLDTIFELFVNKSCFEQSEPKLAKACVFQTFDFIVRCFNYVLFKKNEWKHLSVEVL